MLSNETFQKKFKETSEKWAKYNEPMETFLETTCYVNDALELAWATAESVFIDQAKPEHALKILELFYAQTDKRENNKCNT